MDPRDRNILLIGILAIVVIVVGYYFLLLSPLRSQYAERQQERSSKQVQLSQLQKSVSQLQQVKKNSPTIQRELLELQKRLPNQPEIPTLVVQIQGIARASGVTQLSIQPGTPEPPPGGGDFSRIPITMTFQGTYEQMQNFLLRARNLARLITINQVTYQPASGATSGTTSVQPGLERVLQVQIQAEIYVQPPVSTTGPSTTPTPPAGGTTGSAPGGTTGGG